MYKRLKLVETAHQDYYNSLKKELDDVENQIANSDPKADITSLEDRKELLMNKLSDLEFAHKDLKESVSLKEDDKEEAIENQEDVIDANEELEDVVDTEEYQEENPVQEESLLDTQLDELREVLVDLDLNLYRIASKENPKDVIYVVGKVADNSDDVLMLVDTKPEEVNSDEEVEDIELEDTIDTDELKESENTTKCAKCGADNITGEYHLLNKNNKDIAVCNDCAKKYSLKDLENINEAEDLTSSENEEEQRYDFVILPKSFDVINTMNPRYGEEITPDHEGLMEYLMNCLIEVNPEAAEALQEPESEETPLDIDVDEDLGEEDLEDEN